MESYEKLASDLAKYEKELASISRTVEKSTPFKPGELDGNSERYGWTEYTDPKRAQYLKSRIEKLNGKINNYERDAQVHRIEQERIAAQNEENRKERISSTANELYEEKMTAYMNQNLWGKAKSILSGKKPKKMNSQEIISTYGEEAVSRIIDPTISEISAQKEEQLEKVHELYANDEERLASAIRATNEYFDGEIEKISSAYDSSRKDVISEGKRR